MTFSASIWFRIGQIWEMSESYTTSANQVALRFCDHSTRRFWGIRQLLLLICMATAGRFPGIPVHNGRGWSNMARSGGAPLPVLTCRAGTEGWTSHEARGMTFTLFAWCMYAVGIRKLKKINFWFWTFVHCWLDLPHRLWSFRVWSLR